MVPFKEYRMSTFQVVMFSGIVMGCMLCAFYVGAYFGNKIGFENAMNENLENLAKVPINISDIGKDDVDEETRRNVDEKLKKGNLNFDEDDDLPSVAEIANARDDSQEEGTIEIWNKEADLSANKRKGKLVGEYVEDIVINNNDKRLENKDNNKQNNEDVSIVVEGDDGDTLLRKEIANIKEQTDKEYMKAKEAKKVTKAKNKEEKKAESIKKVTKKEEIKKEDVKPAVAKTKEVKPLPTKAIEVHSDNHKDINVKEVEVKKDNNTIINKETIKPTLTVVEPKLPTSSLNGLNQVNNEQVRPIQQVVVKPTLEIKPTLRQEVNRVPNQMGYQGAIANNNSNPSYQVNNNNFPQNLQNNNNEVKAIIQNGASYIPKGFYVQLASVEDRNEASVLAQKVSESGFKAKIEPFSINGITRYRVIAGPEDTKIHAIRMLEQFKREHYISPESAPFVKEIK